jgi:hypothetical protein
MILHPEKFADGGLWISDDRVYAFISVTNHCVAEIGYHGPQPVSRNSRIFVGRPDVLRFSARDKSGEFLPIVFEDFDWYAGGVRINGRCATYPVALEIAAHGDSLLISASTRDLHPDTLRVTFVRNACFREVHGVRTWTPGKESSGKWETSFRDRILLNEWLKRTGPYTGDFLLPEPLRKKIFVHPVRSGMATAGDLRPEYRDAALPVYDTEVLVSIGGLGYTVETEEEIISFVAPRTPGGEDFPPLEVHFPETGQAHPPPPEAITEQRTHYRRTFRQAPSLTLPGFPRFEEFFSSVPALVESCIVRDYGIPRATPGRYYWIWAWDATVTALAALRWGAGGIAERTVEFINTHRDGNEIPMRWTRALEPLDTQPPGALESLLTSLAHSTAIETGNHEFTGRLYPRLVDHLSTVTASSDPRGLFRNIGFYPDLPREFGRTPSSAVTLEVGCFYTFCRTMENLAHLAGDSRTATLAATAATLLEKEFLPALWDAEEGFLLDAIDLETGDLNRKHPLFSLLFLHSPLGWALVREKIQQLADFIAHRLMADEGVRVLPRDESSVETISNAWYPHWDLYALKALRRAGRRKEILRWLADAERTLGRLGFCPEYIAYGPPESDHGAPSNLNCVTGWYQAFLEGVVGLESDPGGLTVIPLQLPLDGLSLKGISYRGTRWDIAVSIRGERLQSIMVDGVELHGSLKIPVRFADGGQHSLLLTYGEREQPLLFREAVNAEVTAARAERNSVELSVRALGGSDLIYSAPEGSRLTIDGKPAEVVRRLPEGTFAARVATPGEHLLRLTTGTTL